MPRRLACYAFLLTLIFVPQVPAADQAEARRTAAAFGHALTSGGAPALREILPTEGKVRLQLDKLGPEQGYFSAAQVEALLADFLAHGSVRAFEVLRIECEEAVALVRGQALLVDRTGRPARVELHLSLRGEADRWVLREIREHSP